MQDGNISTINSFARQPAAKERRISGRVTDESSVGIAGVSVTLKGATTGTSTDSSGSFSINVPEKNAVLQFSSLNYDVKEGYS